MEVYGKIVNWYKSLFYFVWFCFQKKIFGKKKKAFGEHSIVDDSLGEEVLEFNF